MKPPDAGHRRSVQRALESIWYGSAPAGLLLAPLGWLYGIGIGLRRSAYRRGWFKSVRLPVPVIVVGNISVGGTGKTPVVIWLAQYLQKAGYRPGIVSRGYGGRAGRGPRWVSTEDEWDHVGDEPLLIHRETGAAVVVGSDRVAGADLLVDRGVNVIIADDGLQHYRLARDVEIAVVDGRRRLGNGRLLPAGPLREPASRLQEVDQVLINGGPDEGNESVFRLQGTVAELPDGSRRLPLADFAGQPVRVLAGIGNPARFQAQLAEHGLIITATLPADDHGRIAESVLRSSGPPIFMTAKDAIKYRLPVDGSCWVVPVAVAMPAFIGPWLQERLPPPIRRD